MSDGDKPVIFEHNSLEDFYGDVREEFLEQVDDLLAGPCQDKDTYLHFERGQFNETFDTHIHRYQQLFMFLSDMNLLKNTMLAFSYTTIMVSPDYIEGQMVPVIRHQADEMYVGYEKPPVALDDVEKTEGVTVASIPLLDEDKIPFSGRSVLITTPAKDTEICFVTYDPVSDAVVLMWSDYIVDAVNNTTQIPENQLN